MIRRVNGKYRPFEGCPDFAWIVADTVCNPYQDSDCVIFFVGRKKSGKSTNSVALAEEISKAIAAKIGGQPSDYFTAENIKSVSRLGGLEILTSPQLLKDHAVIIIDDAQISLSSRRSPTAENQLQNDIVTIARPFKCVLIFNSVFHANIDKGTRSLADFIVKMENSNPYTKQSLMRIYSYEVGDDGKEYRKYLQWRDPNGRKHRIKLWVGTLPSPELQKAYLKMRRENSVALVEDSRARFQEILAKRTGSPESTDRKNGIKEIVELNREQANKLRESGMSMKAIARELNLTDYQVSKCLSKVK